ncbi:MAG TPA: SxtJ family membrane protein [Dongiaceae bacterium]|nr:SxtJ family membrane protein [Dongiaceae bacterium]
MSDRGFHEQLASHGQVKLSSDRTFGLVFAAFFTIIGLVPLLHHGHVRWWAIGLAAVFLVVALTVPKILKPFNQLWYQIGRLLHRIVNPVVMGVLFFVVITPAALLLRLAGKDLLKLKRDPEAASYWIHRTPPGPEPQSLKHMF